MAPTSFVALTVFLNFLSINGQLTNDTVQTTDIYAQSSMKFPRQMQVFELHQALFENLVKLLSNGDEAKMKVITKPINGFHTMRSCYLDTFSEFMGYCLPFYDRFQGLKLFRDLLHRSCAVEWLETKVISKHIKRTCEEKAFVTEGPLLED